MTAPRTPGLFRRLAAVLYDTLLLFAVLFVATALVLPLAGGTAIAAGDPFYSLYLLLVALLFFGWFWTHGGQTLGMLAWRVRVQQPDGAPLTARQAVLRFFGAMLSWAALGTGFWWVLVDQRGLAWHDHLSGTRLVLVPKRK